MAGSGEPSIAPARDTTIQGVMIAGKRADGGPEHRLFQKYDTRSKVLAAADDPKAFRGYGNQLVIGATIEGVAPERPTLVSRDGVICATIVKELKWEGKPPSNARIDGHSVIVKDFGTVVLRRVAHRQRGAPTNDGAVRAGIAGRWVLRLRRYRFERGRIPVIRAAPTGLLVVTIAACAPRPEARLQQLYDSATAQLWRGELTSASTAAQRRADARESRGGLRLGGEFRLLTAEILLVSRDLSTAASILSESQPAGRDWASAKQRYLQGQLALLRGQPAEAGAILDDASHLADAASAVDVRLDIGAMKGQSLIAQRKWAEAEAILHDTIERATKRGDRYHEAVALVNLGTAYLFRDRFDDALQDFERVLANKSLESQLVYPVALSNAGVCYYRLGDMPRAIDAQRRQSPRTNTRGGRACTTRGRLASLVIPTCLTETWRTASCTCSERSRWRTRPT